VDGDDGGGAFDCWRRRRRRRRRCRGMVPKPICEIRV